LSANLWQAEPVKSKKTTEKKKKRKKVCFLSFLGKKRKNGQKWFLEFYPKNPDENTRKERFSCSVSPLL
jgi:hypothetical protein